MFSNDVLLNCAKEVMMQKPAATYRFGKHCVLLRMLLLLCFSLSLTCLKSQVLSGKVYTYDEKGKKVPVYMARLQWKNTAQGALSDVDGSYKIPFTTTDTLLIRYSFYNPDTIVVNRRKKQQDFVIKTSQELKEVVVSKRNKQKYKRKNNPAIELVKNVINSKEKYRVESTDCFKSKSYKKTVMTFGRFDMDFNKNGFNRQLSFLKKYIDTIPADTIPVLTFSFRESLSENYYQKSPKNSAEYVIARRMQGADEVLDDEGVGANLEEMFKVVNIFDNDIELMLNKFVSPLSSTLATLHYHYFITDTVVVDSVKCVELSFAPVNSRTFGFTGRMYIVCDGTYALKRCAFNVPVDINMNFVRQLRVEQDFMKVDSLHWAVEKSRTKASFSLIKRKKMRQVYVTQDILWYDYEIGAGIPDSLSGRLTDNGTAQADVVTYKQWQWVRMRPVPLSATESFIDSLPRELRRTPFFRVLEKTAEIVATGYVATAKEKKNSRFDIGPIYDVVSFNPTEGLRFRAGGMTTARLHENIFMNGYLAFGCKDLKLKYNISFAYSFLKKKHHLNESPHHEIHFSSSYDVEMPGQTFSYMDRDNILMSYSAADEDYSAQYVRRTKLRYVKEWASRFSIDTWIQYENNEAAGTLAYLRIGHGGNLEKVSSFNSMEWTVQLRWAPGERLYSNQSGKDNLMRISKNAPVFRVSHTVGSMDGRTWYNKTDLSVEKRFWLSAFGHIDAAVKAGAVWNKAPFPKLYVPPANSSLFMSPNTFCLMKPMEFIMDKYVSVYATYYLKGWIFNRIPLWNRLKLREVVSFSGVYGGLSRKNNPASGNYGLYLFPDGCGQMGKMPYMEITAGVENIFKVLRIDYVRRLTYTQGLSGWKKNGVRLSLRLTF